jgi:hypothetical protein
VHLYASHVMSPGNDRDLNAITSALTLLSEYSSFRRGLREAVPLMLVAHLHHPSKDNTRD